MDALVSLVLFTGLIFVVMQFSKGRAASDATGITAQHEAEHVAPAGHLPEGIDPVCGMRVAAHEGFLVAHHGVEYRFCSLACVETFEKAAPIQARYAA